MVQKVVGISAMVAHQAEKGGSVAQPVMSPEPRRLAFIHAQMLADVGRHRAVNVREYGRVDVVKRVVEVKKPGA